jgi:phosphoglycerate dehydrogenase-like enzyme
MDRLSVAIAAPVPPDVPELLLQREPRIELRYDPDVLPPMRHPADFAGDPWFTRTTEQQRRYEELLDGADALYGIPDVDAAALRRVVEANPHLRWVHTMAAGGGATVKAAGLTDEQLNEIIFTSSAGVHSGPLAEFAIFGVLAGAKDFPRLARQQSERVWSDRWMMGQLAEQTMLVVGLGGIGRRVVELLAPFGGTILGTSRRGVTVDGVDEVVHPNQLVEVAGRADAVISTLPGTDATAGLLGGDFFAALKPGATVVNVGRGTVIEETALIDALHTGRVGFAALDVFATEPLPPESPLWSLPNVLISPHTAALSKHEDRRIAELFCDNATRLLDGQHLRNVINTEEFY